MEMDMLKLVVEVECFGKCVDEFDKVTMLFGEMQLKQEDRSYVHASNELHLHVVHVVPVRHEAAFTLVVCKSFDPILYIGNKFALIHQASVFRKLGINLKFASSGIL
ncbi:hypothetical protein Tco_1384477 [Tanacetum coccineum]